MPQKSEVNKVLILMMLFISVHDIHVYTMAFFTHTDLIIPKLLDHLGSSDQG